LAAVIKKVRAGAFETSRGREILARMIETGQPALAVIDALGIQQVDDSELDALCRELIEANPRIVAEVRAGKVKAAGALIGQAKKKNPNVNPSRVHDRCLEMIRNS
jgi:aspartyl-tRNA(Asn)/glutamyl-tRNA(Gln) amidotransferase subunit B